MSDERSIPPVIGKVPPILAPPRSSRIAPPAARIRRASLLSPEELERYGDLLIFARSRVEGYFAGKHPSPHRGSSVEFTEYREYVPGDDIRRIDWRAYGRTRRLFVRSYESETDMVVYLLVDASASMSYRGDSRQSKYHLAAKIAAALAYLVIHQGDQAALGLFAETLKRYVPAGGTRLHLHQLVNELEEAEPASGTGIARALEECDSLFKKRGRLVLLSDFWDDRARLFEALSRFVHRKFEVLLLHIAHPHELDLPAMASARFHDLESHEEVEVETDDIRVGYRASARSRVDELAREAEARRMQHALVSTQRPYLDAIEAYLGFRGVNTLSSR